MGTDEDYWDDDGVVVVPGFPTAAEVEEVSGPYPAATLGVVKTLRSDGLSVRLATSDIEEISYHAAEDWLPVLHIGIDLLVGAGGNLLASIILKAVGSERSTNVHIKWRVKTRDGVVHTFKFDGDNKAAMKAAKIFERSLDSGCS